MSIAFTTSRCFAFASGAALTLLHSAVASAALINFRIDSVMQLGCGTCAGFEEDTGLVKSPLGLYSVTTRFRIDTETAASPPPPYSGTTYQFNGPRTRMAITVGSLTTKYDDFLLRFLDDGDSDQLYLLTNLTETPGWAGFNTGNGNGTRLADYSLATFAAANLSSFSGTVFDTFVFGPDYSLDRDWWLQGHVRKIVRVPEPGVLTMFCLGLAALGVMRRRSAGRAHV